MVMRTQEPLFNDTTFRYSLLRREIESRASREAAGGGGVIDDVAAVSIAATLGIKGPDFYSCDPAQFEEGGSNVMSVVYAPGGGGGDDGGGARDGRGGGGGNGGVEGGEGGATADAHAWVAWEDATAEGEAWRPAACNAYVRIDLARLW